MRDNHGDDSRRETTDDTVRIQRSGVRRSRVSEGETKARKNKNREANSSAAGLASS